MLWRRLSSEAVARFLELIRGEGGGAILGLTALPALAGRLDALAAERGLLKGERIGVDGSTMEANAALRTIVRRDSGESYRAMLTRMAQESGIETPTAEDLTL